MCGISAVTGTGWELAQLEAMVRSQTHRGPDATRLYRSPCGLAGLGHNRLSIIDLSDAGTQPMRSADGGLHIVLNGELYNYRELRRELAGYPFRSQTDTEVILAAYQKWGAACLDRFIGMFAFAIWDERRQTLFAARDRFGVKPLYYAERADGGLALASELKALWAAGVPAIADETTWATYLATGIYDHSAATFWREVRSLPPGHTLTWTAATTRCALWYDLAQRTGPDYDSRPESAVEEEYQALLEESIRLRFRADVPVGICVSGGLDSSVLLGAIRAAQQASDAVRAFTFTTGDPAYDELPWVRSAIGRTCHPLEVCELSPSQVPALAASVQQHQDEPFGGLPSLAYAQVFDAARHRGTLVLLDGQGMDEQWGGYDYYAEALAGRSVGSVQGTHGNPVRPDSLTPEFRALAQRFQPPTPFPDPLRNAQYRDIRYTKIPRALRFNDRISMRASVELREPFLDHRLMELAIRQAPERKIRGRVHKQLLRSLAHRLMPDTVVEAPKRPIQTPQREWLRGPLRPWAAAQIERGLSAVGGYWLDPDQVRREWAGFSAGEGDSSFFVWQWISLGLAFPTAASVTADLEGARA